ncbi:MAG: hypothetical protein GQ570_03390 [Helicobacteraceae bacterium]|nr:hypothetical protein [Helicobacteraceae bacterium]
MTIKEAILKSLEELKTISTSKIISDYIIKNKYKEFDSAKIPERTISSELGTFIRTGDSRVSRVKQNGKYFYYLSKLENELSIDSFESLELKKSELKNYKKESKKYQERDLHKLLATYLNSKNINVKTIFHEKSNSKDKEQKWVHPDMLGVNFIPLEDTTKNLLKAININDMFKLTSYELKRTINSDYELKESYFQAVSNSSWANYGYLVAFEINMSLMDEMERLNQSFGIGIIELKSNPFESKVLFQPNLRELDFKTIDKLCKINSDFKNFIDLIEVYLTAEDKHLKSSYKELVTICDTYFKIDSEIEEYCQKHHIPLSDNE